MKIIVYMETNIHNSRCEEEVEIDDEELAGLTPEQVDEYIYKEYVTPLLPNLGETGWFPAEGSEDE